MAKQNNRSLHGEAKTVLKGAAITTARADNVVKFLNAARKIRESFVKKFKDNVELIREDRER